MSALALEVGDDAAHTGLKGPRAAEWLVAQGVAVPAGPNSWERSPIGSTGSLLVARLGQTEFFLEEPPLEKHGGSALERIRSALAAEAAGVYPVLREDFAFRLSGEGVHDALAQVCNVDFARIYLDARPVIMTIMTGVAVLALPEEIDGARQYRFWCDPTFAPCLSETLGALVVECGGIIRGVAA